jgi:hypothetical protein
MRRSEDAKKGRKLKVERELMGMAIGNKNS